MQRPNIKDSFKKLLESPEIREELKEIIQNAPKDGVHGSPISKISQVQEPKSSLNPQGVLSPNIPTQITPGAQDTQQRNDNIRNLSAKIDAQINDEMKGIQEYEDLRKEIFWSWGDNKAISEIQRIIMDEKRHFDVLQDLRKKLLEENNKS